jgi:acetoin utilization deacetylase AcuC-like enzyme
MLKFKLVYSDDYTLPIGDHVFPAQKYRLVHQLLLGSRLVAPADFVTPPPATDDDVLLVHTGEYVRALKTGDLTAKQQLEMEVPFSSQLVDAFWLAAGGSILAAELALRDGIAVNIGGGFHHAFPDHGEGFCMINDVAIAARKMLREGKAARVMVLDCDVHQGNGTAAVFGAYDHALEQTARAATNQAWSADLFAPQRPTWVTESDAADVFTVSLHQANNYPAWKPPSSMDVNLPDGTTDAEYLNWLDNALTSALRQFEPDLIAYVAGADPYKEDQLGGLAMTIGGLRQRDEFVFHTAKSHAIPIFATFAGGYARKLEDTVTIHANTVFSAIDVYR